MPHNNTVKALNSHNEVVIGYLADSKTISIVEGSGKGNTEILPNTVRRYICSTTSGTPLYVDDIILADGIHKGIINSENNLTNLGIIKFAIISNGFLQIVIVKQMRLTI